MYGSTLLFNIILSWHRFLILWEKNICIFHCCYTTQQFLIISGLSTLPFYCNPLQDMLKVCIKEMISNSNLVILAWNVCVCVLDWVINHWKSERRVESVPFLHSRLTSKSTVYPEAPCGVILDSKGHILLDGFKRIFLKTR